MTTTAATPKPPLTRRIRRYLAGFWQGFAAPFHGLRYLLRHRDLWPYAIFPMLISLAISAFVLLALAAAFIALIPWIHHQPAFSSTLGRIAEPFAYLALLAVLLACAVAAYRLASGILTGLAHERLARRVELQLGTPPEQLALSTFQQQAIDAILDFLVVIATAAASLLLGCIPVVGLLAAAVNFYIDWRVMGGDFIDIPVALRHGDKKAFAKKHRPQVLGLGAIVFALNFIPILGNVLLTTAAIGAVLLHKRLQEADRQLG